MAGPPRSFVLAADWGNTLAGFLLMCAFLWGALINSVKMTSLLTPAGIPTEFALKWLQFFFCTEGVLYAVAEFFMIGIMANTPPEFGGGAKGCMQFAILMAGGIFFSFSGLVFPDCITNALDVFNTGPCPAIPAAGTPYVWNAVAHYGITCFMIGTAIGFHGVLGAPKDKIISPFWGCTMYFLGAWVIGIFKFWGPVLLGGVSWTVTWWFALIGALFLFMGAVIFGIMNGSFGKCGSAAAPPPAEPNPESEQAKLSAAAAATYSSA